jgi:hypothetical protein
MAMIYIHDRSVGDPIRARIRALSTASRPRWGRMSVGQMLWHCNQVLETSLGDVQVVQRRPPFPVSLLKYLLFNFQMPHGAPTAPEYVPHESRDFESERARMLALIDRFTARDIHATDWPKAVFGQITGPEWSCLQARHLDHHLRQFGV